MHNYFNPNESTATSIETPQDNALSITFFNNINDISPKQSSTTWAKLCTLLSKHAVSANKLGSPTWSPVSYKPGTTRGSNNVDAIYLAVLDIDNGTPIEEMKVKLQGQTALLHSSYRHTKEYPKYRVVMPLVKPVLASEWELAWLRINAYFGGINDSATKDASRLYFLPVKQFGAEGHFVEILEGAWLDVDSLPELATVTAVNDFVDTSIFSANVRHNSIEGIEEIPPDLSPSKGLDEVLARCKFMQVVSAPEKQDDVSEPLWMAMITNSCCFEDRQEWIHEASCHHSGYSEKETNKKIARFQQRGGPNTCARIRSLGFAECPNGGCALPSGEITKAPAGLWTWLLEKNKATKNAESASSRPKTKEKVPTISGMPELVDDFSARYMPLRFVNGSFQGYTGGYWPRLDDKADVRRAIAQYLGGDAKVKELNEIFTLLSDFKAEKDSEVPENKSLICLNNGTLDTESYTLLEHSQDHRLTTKTDIQWNPEATCPRWMQFLDEIFANDIDKAEKISFVQAWCGYCLVPDNSQHKFVWMVGGGGNGKSVLLSILTKLVGHENVSHAYIERLEEKFVRAELEGKLINISPEMSADATISDSYLKSIVSGDIVEAERKFKPSFSFRPYVRLIGATNHLPRLLDLSDGFFRRAIILGFNRQFTGPECDPHLEQKLILELPGILVWAVDGLRRLRERGSFEIPQSSVAVLAEYRTENDPVKQFAEECLVKDEAKAIRSSEIYKGYRAWSHDKGFSPLNLVRFGRRLGDLGYGKCRSSKGACWKVSRAPNDEYLPSEFSMQQMEVALIQKEASEKERSVREEYKL